ncbi:hypothetical protein SAMN05444354_101105 [Stigmatella aurantiaca]|uniref:Lipoprotein n=1 Tax=Stigmatella aurantiaca TaxID=41 RepID=A0A1H7FPJ8_STIAU|nr:hypothetical protein [Stigmatella aurantiaca]SEK25305.1 hypothetical protein SAMN05444354_101105 [Stigmatella aurantiaca]
MSQAGPGLRRGLVGLLAAGGLLGCGGPNSLSGSVEELFSLEVSRVEVLRNAEALQVSYYRNAGQDVDLVVRLTLATEGLDLRPGKKVNLAGTTPSGMARTTVVHLSAGEPARLFGPVDKGDLSLDEGGGIGESTSGDFSLSFQRGDSYGAGRSLEGRFSAVALDAGFGPEPLPPEGIVPSP